MKKDNKPSPVEAVILAINLLPTDDSDTLDYTSKGRAIKNLCYNTTNDSRYLKSSHHQEKQKWALLKEDSTGSEITRDSIVTSENRLHSFELHHAVVKELNVRGVAAHQKFFGKEYVMPVKGTKLTTGYSTQERDSDWEPSTL